MIESIIFIFIPSVIILPYSTRYIINTKLLDMSKLSYKERYEISNNVIITGLASMGAFFAFIFGLFGKYSPNDIFMDNYTAQNIINIRTKNTCCICLNKYKYDENIKVFSCNHCYHKECINKWLIKNRHCPICRKFI